MIGGDGADDLNAGESSILSGGAGNDTLLAFSGSSFYGGDGDDEIVVDFSGYYTNRIGKIEGGHGDDKIDLDFNSSNQKITFRRGDGFDTVNNLFITNNKLDLVGFGLTKEKISNLATFVGGDVLIDFGGGDGLKLFDAVPYFDAGVFV